MAAASGFAVPSIRNEFSGADLGDGRRSRRLVSLAELLADNPSASFPEAAGGEAALEATYRFFGNDAVHPDDILHPHFEQSARRASVYDAVLVLHDTSSLEFPGENTRTGLGHLRGKGQGFFGHVSLAVAPGEERCPLGVLALSTIVRGKVPKKKRLDWAARKSDSNSESKRWLVGVENSETQLSGRTSAIHIMDREGDSYALLFSLIAGSHRFVIRLNHNRRTVDVGEQSMKLTARGRHPRLSDETARPRRLHPPSPHPARAVHPRRLKRCRSRPRRSRSSIRRSFSPSRAPWARAPRVRARRWPAA